MRLSNKVGRLGNVCDLERIFPHVGLRPNTEKIFILTPRSVHGLSFRGRCLFSKFLLWRSDPISGARSEAYKGHTMGARASQYTTGSKRDDEDVRGRKS